MKIKTINTIAVIAIFALSVLLGYNSVTKTVSAANLACIDSDGGININTFGTVEISSPALPETRNDSCLNLETTITNGETTVAWIEGTTGTHVSEFSCVDTTTGSFMNSVHLCAYGCNSGVCNPAPLSYTVTKVKVEGKGIINNTSNNELVINNLVAHYDNSTIIKLNYQTSIMVGQKAEYKGFKNSDGSVTLTKIEIIK